MSQNVSAGAVQARHDRLLKAVRAGNLEYVRKGLAADGAARAYLLGHVPEFSTALLSAAVEADQPEMVDVLLDAGFNIERTAGIPDNQSRFPTPAYEAVARGQLDMVRHLIGRGADINARNPASQCNMLMEALSKKDTAMALSLLDMGIGFGGDALDKNGYSAVNYAASVDDVEVYLQLWNRDVFVGTDWNRLSFAIRYPNAHKIVAACLANAEYRTAVSGREGKKADRWVQFYASSGGNARGTHRNCHQCCGEGERRRCADEIFDKIEVHALFVIQK